MTLVLRDTQYIGPPNTTTVGIVAISVQTAIATLLVEAPKATACSVRHAIGPILAICGDDDKLQVIQYQCEGTVGRKLNDLCTYLRLDVGGLTQQSLNLLPSDAAAHLLKQNQARGALILAADLLHYLDSEDEVRLMDMSEDDFVSLISQAIEGSNAFELLQRLPR